MNKNEKEDHSERQKEYFRTEQEMEKASHGGLHALCRPPRLPIGDNYRQPVRHTDACPLRGLCTAGTLGRHQLRTQWPSGEREQYAPIGKKRAYRMVFTASSMPSC